MLYGGTCDIGLPVVNDDFSYENTLLPHKVVRLVENAFLMIQGPQYMDWKNKEI